MEWSEEKNILLVREVLNVEPYNAKERTTQRAQLWQRVADNLNNHHSPKFKVDKRAVRDHLNMIIEKFKKKMKEEESASGISPEPSELDVLLEEVIERIEVANEVVQVQKEKTKEKMEKGKKDAEDIRLKAMEKLGESKKRSVNEEPKEKNSKRGRSNGTDTVNYLRERAEIEQQYRERELEIKNKQLESSMQHKVQSDQQHREFMQLVLSQQQQQQQQQHQQMQQFQMMLNHQQQQQQQLLLALLNKKAD